MENIKLDNNQFLNRDYGKYNSGLTIISDCELDSNWNSGEMDSREISKFFDGDVSVVIGKFFVSRKGTKCWDTKGTDHLLITVDWGGSFNHSRGGSDIPEEDFIFINRKSSNGGGTGKTYYILPVGYNFVMAVDDI
ncbi:MAG: hypothetical protein ACTSWW_04830 [Promethearchaeota archaeon]